MSENQISIEKNKELLLADLLIKNQELQQSLDETVRIHGALELRCKNLEERSKTLDAELKTVRNQNIHHSKQLAVKEKKIDSKIIEINDLEKRLKKSEQNYKNLQEQIRSAEGDDKENLTVLKSLVKELQQEKEQLSSKNEITDQQCAKLDFHNRKMRFALQGGHQGLWDYNMATDEFVFDESWCNLLGFEQQFLKRDLEAFMPMIHEKDRKQFRKEFELLKLRQSGGFDLTLRILKRDNTYIKVVHSGSVFREDRDHLTITGYSMLLMATGDAELETINQQLGELNNENEAIKRQLNTKNTEIESLQQQANDLNETRTELANTAREKEDLIKNLADLETQKLQLEEKLFEAANGPAVDDNELAKKDLDIQYLKEELKALQLESSNLSLVAKKTENAIIITNKDGGIEYVNEGFERLTEFSESEVLGKKPGDFLQGEETNPEHVQAIRDGLASGKPFSQDIINYSKSGRKYWLSISITPIFDEDGELERFIAVERDITDTKQRDAELEDAEKELRELMEEQFVNSEKLIKKEKELSEALAESERVRQEIENLSMVASRTDNAVIITDAQGQILYVNEGFERITEYASEEVLGKVPGRFLQGPDTNPEHVAAIREGLRSKKPFKQEILNYSKNGRAYWLNIAINPIFDEDGNVEKFIAIESEITEQKKKEAEYANLSLVASRTDNAVIITDRFGMIEWVNEGFERLTEYKLDEVKGKKPGSFLQGANTRREDVKIIRDGIKSQKPFKHEIYNYSKSGRGYWLSVSITPTFKDDGSLDKFIAIESDITEEKQAQDELEKLSLVASRTDNAVIITDRQGAIEWVNDGFRRITEYTLDEVKGKKPGEFLQGEKTRQEDVMAIRKGLKSMRPFRHEIYNYSKSGRGYWLSLSITPIFDDGGEVEKFIAIESDITKQKEAEIELENLSLVASKTDNAVIITSVNGEIEWVNEGFTHITEYKLEEVKGKKPGAFLQGEETRQEDVIAIRKGLKSQKPFTAEIYNYSKSGRGYWLSLSITPIFDEYGIVEKFIAIERDITEAKQLAAEIEESEEQMRTLMDEQFASQERLISQEDELKKALEASEILSLVASKTDNAVIVTNKDGHIQYVNDGFIKITGYTFEEVKGKKPGTFLQGPDTDPKHVLAIREGLESKKPFTQEILNYSKTGKPYWLSISMTPILDDAGEVEKFIAIESDISERKAAEEEMKNLSLVASKTDNAVIITNKNGNIEWVNEGFEKITEYSFDEVIGKKPGSFLQGKDTKEEQVVAIRKGLESLVPFTAEIYNYSKSGRGYWLSLSITPIFDENRQLEKFIAIESDITERKNLEIEIQESEEQMRELMDGQFANSEALMKKEEELNRALEDERKSKQELDDAIARLKDTQTQMVQNEKMASIGQLTAGIAHEINNPINFVYNGIDSLNMSLEDLTKIMSKYNELDHAQNGQVSNLLEEIADMKKRLRFEKLMKNLPTVLADIKNGANRTIEIVKGLRVFSRLDEEDQKAANINECLDSTLILLRNKTKDKIVIKKFFDESLGDIMCFPGQLNQVFMNLLSNAIQAIPEERNDGQIMIYTENLEKSVIIRIMDNGSGIPDDVKKKIFEPFFTTKPVGIGTGLGLSITYGIIEKHDGKIYVNSEVDRGTEFVIELPKESKKITKIVGS